jgi:hypothetical protein
MRTSAIETSEISQMAVVCQCNAICRARKASAWRGMYRLAIFWQSQKLAHLLVDGMGLECAPSTKPK